MQRWRPLRGAGGPPLSVRSFLRRLADDPAYGDALSHVLAAAPFEAFFWECRPLDPSLPDEPFEFVLVDAGHAPALTEATADRSAFAAELDRARGERAVAFPNLGGDARLIAPTGRGPWAHLAAFCRSAPPADRHELWEAVARAALERLASDGATHPFWLSTSGLGVPWLHVRLDDRPKYITWAPYREVR